MTAKGDIADKDFDVSNYLRKSLDAGGVQRGDEVKKLRQLRRQVHKLVTESSQAIKDSIFQNYEQFIETAKDISYLEGEMYQLNHLLNEQKALIESMQDIAFSDLDKAVEVRRGQVGVGGRGAIAAAPPPEECQRSLNSLLDRVEGSVRLADKPNRFVIMDGDLVELDIETRRPVRSVHCFLISDGFVVTSFLSQRLSPSRFKFECVYPLENVAISDVRDDNQSINYCFKLLAFPEQKCYRCDDAGSKPASHLVQRQWVESVERAKRRWLELGSFARQATIRGRSRPPYEELNQPAAAQYAPSAAKGGSNLEEGGAETEWLRELPDELDVCIAQRDFDSAVELLFEGRENLEECGGGPVASEVRDKLSQKERQLISVLAGELRAATEKTLQGGPKFVRKSISLLVRLGRSSLACDLFLKNHSAATKQALSEVRIAEDPLSYVRAVVRIVFGNLADTAHDFQKLFVTDPGCCAVLVRWSSAEVKSFVNLILRHVFEPGPSLLVLGQSINLILSAADELSEVGLDLRFEMEKLMMPSIEKAIQSNCQNLIQVTRVRNAEDKWKPNNLQSEANLLRFVEEMNDFGLRMDVICEPGAGGGEQRCRTWVSASVAGFARCAVEAARDLPSLRLADVRLLCDSALVDLFYVELQHLAAAGPVPNPSAIVEACRYFVLSQLLPLCQRLYSEGFGLDPSLWSPLTKLLNDKFPHLAVYQTARVPPLAQRPAANDDERFEIVGDV